MRSRGSTEFNDECSSVWFTKELVYEQMEALSVIVLHFPTGLRRVMLTDQQ